MAVCHRPEHVIKKFKTYVKYCTVNVRNPDVRISAFSKIVRFPNSPDFRRYLKSGHFRPDFERSIPYYNIYISQPDVRILDVYCIFIYNI